MESPKEQSLIDEHLLEKMERHLRDELGVDEEGCTQTAEEHHAAFQELEERYNTNEEYRRHVDNQVVFTLEREKLHKNWLARTGQLEELAEIERFETERAEFYKELNSRGQVAEESDRSPE